MLDGRSHQLGDLDLVGPHDRNHLQQRPGLGAGPGSTIIKAAEGSVFGTTTLTVTASTLTAIAVTPSNPSITAGTTQQFTATGTYSDGSTGDLTGSVAWTSSNTGVATIDGTGLATAVSMGLATITATSGSVSGAATMTVNPAVISTVSASWGTAGSASLETAADGLRLLPVGRNTDLPWLGVNQLSITLNGSVSLASGDIVVTSASGPSTARSRSPVPAGIM